MKNPGIAAILSFFYTGLGQIYNGQIAKGLILMLLRIISDVLIWMVIGLITSPLLWIYGMYDAYQSAKRMEGGGGS